MNPFELFLEELAVRDADVKLLRAAEGSDNREPEFFVYLINGETHIVQRYIGGGFDIYSRLTKSNQIIDTAKAVIAAKRTTLGDVFDDAGYDPNARTAHKPNTAN